MKLVLLCLFFLLQLCKSYANGNSTTVEEEEEDGEQTQSLACTTHLDCKNKPMCRYGFCENNVCNCLTPVTKQEYCYNITDLWIRDDEKDTDDHDPCFVWTREKNFREKYPKPIIHGKDFWNIEVTLKVNVSYMKAWYKPQINVLSGGLLPPYACTIDLTKCSDGTKPTTEVSCKCRKSESLQDGAFKKYTLYMNQKAEVNHGEREIAFRLVPKEDSFPVNYRPGYVPTVYLPCKERCDKLKQAANYNCRNVDDGEKAKCDSEGCICLENIWSDMGKRGMPEWIDPKSASKASQMRMRLLNVLSTVLMCCTALLCSFI